MVCLETDFLVDLLRNKKEAILKLEELVQKNSGISVTPISLTELFHGAFKSKNQLNVENVEKIMAGVELLDFDFFASKKAGELIAFLEEKGEKIGDNDTITAAIALRHGEKIITRNAKHFDRIPGIKAIGY